MKALKLILLALLSITLKTYSQGIYTINFQNKAITPPSTTTGSVQIQINNFNPYLYKVTVTSKDSVLDESLSVPPLWDYLSNFDNIQKLLEKLKGAAPSTPSEGALENFKKAKDSFVIATTNTATTGSGTISATDKAATIAALRVLSTSLQAIENYFITNVYPNINDHMYRLGALKSITKMDYIDPTTLTATMTLSTTALSTFSAVKTQNLAAKTQIYGLINQFEIFVITNNSNIEKSSIDAYVKGMWERCISLEELSNTIDTTFSSERYTELYSTIVNLTANNFTYHSLPIQVSEDITKINIKIEPRDESKNVLSHSYSTQLILQERKKFNVGFSTGFYYSGLYNSQYYNQMEVNAGDTVYRAASKNPDIGEIGVNALFNAYWQPRKAFGWGGCAGVGIVIDEKVLPRLFAGTSFSFGEKNKFVLSLGGAVGKVDVLSDQYKGDNKQLVQDFTVSRYQFSGFVSFGYTLFSSKSKE